MKIDWKQIRHALRTLQRVPEQQHSHFTIRSPNAEAAATIDGEQYGAAFSAAP